MEVQVCARRSDAPMPALLHALRSTRFYADLVLRANLLAGEADVYGLALSSGKDLNCFCGRLLDDESLELTSNECLLAASEDK
jgi:hypothetical protein